ncbi:GNAT family N-acetyltransferase [Paenibacillus solisilvae]|uniref:GNAT family N-acetyltransferase n=1 Tax=Paenibacillus solisilvae TaxID=2486751 RepID=A0ABW0VZR6_9BACL
MAQMITMDVLDEMWWPKARGLYHEAFPHGRKPDSIIAAMFERKMSYLHLIVQGEIVIAMAITGRTGPSKSLLLIDYLAVREDCRGQGLGKDLVEEIKLWAEAKRGHSLSGMIVEVESEETPENRKRILFWEKCGFTVTDYVHTYIWVPEPYRAMYMKLEGGGPAFHTDGESLFKHITSFHNQAFRK